MAILPVVLFHADVPFFTGGFYGVDIFFVISGYLITSIINKEIRANQFSFVKFYERRFRRILPVLLVVIFSTLVIGALWLPSVAFSNLAYSALSATFFTSNLYFYGQVDYFDPKAESNPLLHTWSLSVEEQFYFIFPWLILGASRYGGLRYKKWILGLAAISLMLCTMDWAFENSRSFYLISSRAWELLVGALLALGIGDFPRSRLANNVMGLTGLTMMTIAVLMMGGEEQSPVIYALVPTLGAALVLLAGSTPGAISSQLLALRPCIFIGQISYSLYLWHWPIIVFTRIFNILPLQTWQTVLMLVFTIVMATLSWFYIEQPFRTRRCLPGKQSFLIAIILTGITIAGISVWIIKGDGLPWRMEETSSIAAVTDEEEWKYWLACENVVERLKESGQLCQLGDSTKPPEFMLWGDSHAAALASAVQGSALRVGSSGVAGFRSGCSPFYLHKKNQQLKTYNQKACFSHQQRVMAYLKDNPQIRIVILGAYWNAYALQERYKNEKDSNNLTPDMNNIDENFRYLLDATIEQLQSMGKKVILIRQVPEVGYDVRSSSIAAHRLGRDINQIIAPSVQNYRVRTHYVTSLFTHFDNDPAIRFVDPSAYLCDKQQCRVEIEGVTLYRDEDHLSPTGAKQVSVVFDKVLSGMHGWK